MDLRAVNWDVLYGQLGTSDEQRRDYVITTWRRAIETLCASKKQAHFNMNELKNAFRYKGKVPCCLDDVVEDMLRNGEVKEVQTSQKSQSSSWLKAGWEWLFGGAEKYEPLEPRFLLRDQIQTMADKLMSIGGELDDPLVPFEELLQLASGFVADELTLRYVVKCLSENQNCRLISGLNGQELVQFAVNGNATNPSEAELQLARLKAEIKRLEVGIEQNRRTIDELEEKIKEKTKQGQTSEINRYFQRRKLIQASMTSKERNLSMIEQLMFNVQNAAENKKVLDVVKGAQDSFRNILPDVTKADDVIFELSELIEGCNDLDRIMAMPLNSSSDEELQQELNSFLDTQTKDGAGTTDSSADSSLAPAARADQVGAGYHSQSAPIRSRSPRSVAVEKTSSVVTSEKRTNDGKEAVAKESAKKKPQPVAAL